MIVSLLNVYKYSCTHFAVSQTVTDDPHIKDPRIRRDNPKNEEASESEEETKEGERSREKTSQSIISRVELAV